MMKYILVGGLAVGVFALGFIVGQGTAGIPFVPGTIAPNGSSVRNEAAAGGATLDASALSSEQRQMLEALGIDPNNITITPAMIACAEAKLGAGRIEEIKNGAAPSFGESMELLACYRSS